MTGNTNFIQKYQESLDVLSSETVEYIRGIQVIKIFGAKVTSFKALNKAINDYAKFAYKYSFEWETPFVLFNGYFWHSLHFDSSYNLFYNFSYHSQDISC